MTTPPCFPLPASLEKSPIVWHSESARALLPVWRDSLDACALFDAERHFAHVVRAGEGWIAYDATHANSSGDGFKLVGYFEDCALAKLAVERASGAFGRLREAAATT